jgi:transcriptional repressor NrdR
MRCPKCASLEDKVIESRALADGRTIRRRRECLSCGYRFTSYERAEEKQLMVVKKSKNRREPFDRIKLE